MKEQVQFYDFSWRGSPPRRSPLRVIQRNIAQLSVFKYLAFLILVLSSLNLRAQDVGLEWAKGFLGPTTSTTVFTSVAKDAAGNVYVGGRFEGTLDFDPGPGIFNITSPAGRRSSFAVKLDPFGNFLWAKSLDVTLNTSLGDAFLKVDPAGNVYMSGSFAQTVDFDPGPGVYNLYSTALSEIYLLKLDTNGNFVFAQSMGGGGSDYVYNMEIDGAGNIYLVGGFYYATTPAIFGPFSLVSAGLMDGYIVKIDPTGAYLWAKRIGSSVSLERIYGIDTDVSGNVYIGLFTSGPSTGIANLPSGRHLIKLNGDGDLQWTYQQLNFSNGASVTLDIAADASGNVYTTGSSAAGQTNLLKINSDGTLAWEKRIGSGLTLTLRDDNNLYVAGSYSAADATIGSFTLPSSGTYDAFVARLDGAGNVLMAKAFWGGGITYGNDVVATGGDIYITGTFDQTVDFDPSACVYNLTATGTYNGFVVKLTDQLLPAGVTVSATSLSPLSQQTCTLGIPQVILGNVVQLTGPSGYNTTLSYQWQKASSASGPWLNMDGEIYKDLQPLAATTSQYYRRLVTAQTSSCGVFAPVDTSAVAAVTVSANVAPIASADGPQWFVCGPGTNTVALTGTATGGSGSGYAYQWFEGSTSSGTPLSSSAGWTTPAVTQATTYTLKVTDGAGCVDIDQVTIVPAIANAGADQSICQGAGGVQIGTPPVSSPAVSYAWSSLSGAPVSSLSLYHLRGASGESSRANDLPADGYRVAKGWWQLREYG